MVFARGIRLSDSLDLRGKRRLQRPRRGTDDQGLRTPLTKCAGRALFDKDATPCTPSVLSPSHSSRCAINLYLPSESYSPLALFGVTKTEKRTSAPLLLQQLTQVVNPFAFENRTKLGVATITLGKIVTVFITECPN